MKRLKNSKEIATYFYTSDISVKDVIAWIFCAFFFTISIFNLNEVEDING